MKFSALVVSLIILVIAIHVDVIGMDQEQQTIKIVIDTKSFPYRKNLNLKNFPAEQKEDYFAKEALQLWTNNKKKIGSLVTDFSAASFVISFIGRDQAPIGLISISTQEPTSLWSKLMDKSLKSYSILGSTKGAKGNYQYEKTEDGKLKFEVSVPNEAINLSFAWLPRFTSGGAVEGDLRGGEPYFVSNVLSLHPEYTLKKSNNISWIPPEAKVGAVVSGSELYLGKLDIAKSG